MQDVIKSMFSDSVNGSVSSKRVVTFLAFVLCAIGFIANACYGHAISDTVYNSMMLIVVSGLGFTGAEKFAPKD